MKVNVKLIPQEKEFKEMEIKKDATGQTLLDKLGLTPDAHIITREGEPISLDEGLEEGDNIGVIKVVSGG